MVAPLELFAACQPGLESLLARELQALGADGRQLPGGVAFQGDPELVMRAGLWLGTASHVLLRLGQFQCRALGELQRKAAQLPWRSWLRSSVPIDVRATTKASRVYHTDAAAERVANGIAEALGKVPPAARAGDEQVARIHVRFRDDVCTLSLDSTGTPLHRRGYRLESAKAPLREDLAHALVLASGWQPGQALLDPFCGSGTIAIEAAGLALGLAPGRLRAAPLQHLALFDQTAWRAAQVRPDPAAAPAPIHAGDRDAGAIAAARANAERAGVAKAIEFHEAAITAQPWLQPGAAPERGALVTNPPFGLRVKQGDRLLPLYQTLGHRAARLGAAWRVGILAHDVRLARRTGLVLQAAFTTRHGGLAVTALCGTAEARPARPAGGPAAEG